MMREMQLQQYGTALNITYRVGIYCRLSKDDELDGESASISNQRDMLEQYCEGQGWEVIDVFQDDGYTGLNMERPDLNRLLKAVEKGAVNLVITKDLSRLGRNYLQTGNLIEDFFPRHGVRYIAMNDNIDTMQDNNEIAPFKNILNEMYSRDISKKVHASYYLKATKGQFTGVVAPFGYRKDPDDKNHLIPDEETAPIVKKIFSYAVEGHGANYIIRRLELEKIPCPTWWNRQRGLRMHYTKWELKDPENGKYVWDFSAIKDLLLNPVYKGAIASQKTHYKFKLGTLKDKKPSEWIVVEGQHEHLVEPVIFDIVQDKIKSRQRPRQGGDYNIFAGLLKCGECGKSLTIRYTHAKNPLTIFSCKTYNSYGKHHCTQHRVEYDMLYQAVLEKIQECARKALADSEDVAERLHRSQQTEVKARRENLSKTITKKEERIATLEKMTGRLYEDMIEGRITESTFDVMLGKTQKEKQQLEENLAKEKEQLAHEIKLDEDARNWLATIQEYAEITELNVTILNRLIKEIIIHERIDQSKKRHISMEIHFNLRPLPELGNC